MAKGFRLYSCSGGGHARLEDSRAQKLKGSDALDVSSTSTTRNPAFPNHHCYQKKLDKTAANDSEIAGCGIGGPGFSSLEASLGLRAAPDSTILLNIN